jgi:hypothetical protein
MTKAATLPFVLFLLLAPAAVSYAQEIPPQQTAVEEVIRRQAARLTLRDKLAAAQAAEARQDLQTAGTLYDDAWVLIQSIGTGVDNERAQVKAGLWPHLLRNGQNG